MFYLAMLLIAYCADPYCLDCTSDRDKCRHCIGFVEEDTGQCLSSCEGDYKFLVEGSEIGRVCPGKFCVSYCYFSCLKFIWEN